MKKDAIDAIDFYSIPGMASGYYEDFYGKDNFWPINILEPVICQKFPEYLRPKGGRMVDLGCGPGNTINRIVDVFKFKEVVAIDASVEMISFVNEQISQNGINLRTQVADLRYDNLNLVSNSTDLVVSLCVMTYLNDLEKMFSEAGRILKTNGLFVFTLKVHSEKTVETFPVFGGSVPLWQFFYHDCQIISLINKNNFAGLFRYDLEYNVREQDPISTEHYLYFLVKK